MHKSYLTHNSTSHKYMGKSYKLTSVHIKISFSNTSNIYLFFIVIYLFRTSSSNKSVLILSMGGHGSVRIEIK